MCELQLNKFLKLTKTGNFEDINEYLNFNAPIEFTEA